MAKLVKVPYKLTIYDSGDHARWWAKTGTVQVREELGNRSFMIVKQFRYKRCDRQSRAKAIERAEVFIARTIL